MEEPLWIDRHRPDIEEFPQEDLIPRLERATQSPLNLFLHGPPGAGKTAAANAVARELHDDPENDVVTINVADFFNRTKKEIRDDPRFSGFLQGQVGWSKQYSGSRKYKRNWSKRDMIAHVVGEYASIPPTSSEYKTLILDNAEDLREDFQQALRRIIERHYESTQFVITSRSAGAVIPAIRSRCFVIPVPNPADQDVRLVLDDICEREDVAATDDALDDLAGRADGNIRSAILSLQTAAAQSDEVTVYALDEILTDIGHTDEAEAILTDAERGELWDARKRVDSLLDDEGFDGRSVLQLLSSAAHRRYEGNDLAHFVDVAAEVDLRLAEARSDRVQLMRFVSEVAAES